MAPRAHSRTGAAADPECYPYSGSLRWSGRIDSRAMEAGLWSDEREGVEIVVRTRRVTAPAMNQGQAPRHASIIVGLAAMEGERRGELEGRWNAPRKAGERRDG